MDTRERIRNADAIVYPLMFSPEESPEWRKPDQYFVMFGLETPTGKPTMNAMMKHKERFYNLTMTYRGDSDIRIGVWEIFFV